VLAGMNAPAWSQSGYPSGPIRLIVPFAAGGSADSVARLVAEQLSLRLGQAVIVETRTGASGNIGTELVAKSEPDGRTLLLGFDGTLVINPFISTPIPFNSVTDFAPIGKIGDVPLLIIANPKVPAKTLAELIALSKTEPNGLAYGTAGVGSTQHLMMELLKQRTGANFVHVPYKGAAPAMVDVLGGQIPLVGAALAGSLAYIHAGQLRALSISSGKRSKDLPDVPTLSESGFDGLVITAWHGLLAPANTPRPIVDRINRELDALLTDAVVSERLNAIGSIPAPGTPEAFRDQIKNDLVRYAQLVKSIGINPQ